MAQGVRGLTAVTKDLFSVPRKHVVVHSLLQLQFWDLMPPSYSVGTRYAHGTHTYMKEKHLYT